MPVLSTGDHNKKHGTTFFDAVGDVLDGLRHSSFNWFKNHPSVARNFGLVALSLLGLHAVTKEKLEDGRFRQISRFSDLSNGVLVICANEEEYGAVLSTLRQRNQGRDRNDRIHLSSAIPRALAQARYQVPTFELVEGSEDRYRQTGRTAVQLYIANAATLSGRELVRAFSTRHIDPNFNIIQYRGHTADMQMLVDYGKAFQADQCLRMLGGCEGTQFMPQLHSPKTPVIAEDWIGESARNTYMLLKTVRILAGGQAANWSKFAYLINRDAERSAQEFVLPGESEYGEFVKRR